MNTITVGDSWRKFRANMYAPTSTHNPSRLFSEKYGQVQYSHWDSEHIASDPAGILCHPTEDNGGKGLPDLNRRRVAKLSVAADYVADKRRLKAVRLVLQQFVVGHGPQCIAPTGELVVPLAYDGELLFEERSNCKSWLEEGAEDSVASIVCAKFDGTTSECVQRDFIKERRYTHIASHLIELAGQWSNGTMALADLQRATTVDIGDTLSYTRRDRLPMLYRDDINKLLFAICDAVDERRAAA